MFYYFRCRQPGTERSSGHITAQQNHVRLIGIFTSRFFQGQGRIIKMIALPFLRNPSYLTIYLVYYVIIALSAIRRTNRPGGLVSGYLKPMRPDLNKIVSTAHSNIPCLRIIHTGSRPRRVDMPAVTAMITVPHGDDPASAAPFLPVSRPGTVSFPGRTGPVPPDEPASAPVYGVRP